MKRTKFLLWCVAVSVLALCSLLFSALTNTPKAFVEAVPMAPANVATGAEPVQPPLTNCCLRRINKVMKGNRTADFGVPYNCDTGQTFKGVTKIALTLNTTNPTCDQDVAVPNGSRLEAACSTIRRADLFGHSVCEFIIKHPTSGVTHFSGSLVLVDRASQPPPTGCRTCNTVGFLEGWIDGKGQGQFASLKLQAVVTARATMPTTNQTRPFLGDLNGTLLKCP